MEVEMSQITRQPLEENDKGLPAALQSDDGHLNDNGKRLNKDLEVLVYVNDDGGIVQVGPNVPDDVDPASVFRFPLPAESYSEHERNPLQIDSTGEGQVPTPPTPEARTPSENVLKLSELLFSNSRARYFYKPKDRCERFIYGFLTSQVAQELLMNKISTWVKFFKKMKRSHKEIRNKAKRFQERIKRNHRILDFFRHILKNSEDYLKLCSPEKRMVEKAPQLESPTPISATPTVETPPLAEEVASASVAEEIEKIMEKSPNKRKRSEREEPEQVEVTPPRTRMRSDRAMSPTKAPDAPVEVQNTEKPDKSRSPTKKVPPRDVVEVPEMLGSDYSQNPDGSTFAGEIWRTASRESGIGAELSEGVVEMVHILA